MPSSPRQDVDDVNLFVMPGARDAPAGAGAAPV
jgi:hypothetical protein